MDGLSILVPLFDERDNVEGLYAEVVAAADALGRPWELILVDDGSTDGTGDVAAGIARRDPRVTLIRFARNFGQTAALAAGIEHARGEIIVPLDGDLQNDPRDIGRLLETLDRGYDVVSGWRVRRRDSRWRVLPSRAANALISWVSGVRLHDYGCTLKAYRREVLQDVHLYGEMHRFVPVYATWRGARVAEVPVGHRPRRRGRSKYGFERIAKVLLDLIVVKFLTSYLTKPIYVFGGFSLVILLLSIVAGLAAVAFKLIPADNPLGPAWHKDFVATPLPVVAVGGLVLSIQTLLIGLLAELLMRTYHESQGKRSWVIQSIERLAPPAPRALSLRPAA